ncbi:(2Fe-2S)-binding protein [Bordetella sp. BOR01]|uniref:(2Fe-2S)-binding protein n=1 Tax=Bordetella sp. BOR01 TaxID=2854779 RepID=UPI001C43CE81|nr:(2Fe-2S)-binding protein [Bordetella sp. BOR01]MBV7483718.1 (2Fe-2S)-binding protein [Bordetella sp. BOR01]
MSTAIHINGARHEIDAQDQRLLLDILRNELGLKGSHFGCGAGNCGACMVLVDEVPVYACNTPLWSVAGKQVLTVEGLARHPAGARVQRAFIKHGAAQCGYCTSGMVVAAAGLLARCPAPDGRQIREHMDRNLCRCGSHLRVIRAISDAAADSGDGGGS